ncbi:hypothetical protein G6F24_010733 [Rhizopus arrhizus]|nr:hypothetical protein G6F24_010733 [Rhizopus arrhizus]
MRAQLLALLEPEPGDGQGAVQQRPPGEQTPVVALPPGLQALDATEVVQGEEAEQRTDHCQTDNDQHSDQ